MHKERGAEAAATLKQLSAAREAAHDKDDIGFQLWHRTLIVCDWFPDNKMCVWLGRSSLHTYPQFLPQMLPPPGDPHTRRRQVHIPVFILPGFSPPSVISKPVALSFRQWRAPAVWSSDRLLEKSYTTGWTAVRARERVANSYKQIAFYRNFQFLFRAHFCDFHIFPILFPNIGMRSLPTILASVKFRNLGDVTGFFLPFWSSNWISKACKFNRWQHIWKASHSNVWTKKGKYILIKLREKISWKIGENVIR